MRMLTIADVLAGTAVASMAMSAPATAPTSAPTSQPEQTITIESFKDGTSQSAVFYVPAEARIDSPGPAVPLMVGLHTWSNDCTQDNGYLAQATKRGWVLIKPNYRGPNNKPETCASELAVQDILDAVEYAKKNAKVDINRIYLVGYSGGGHMSLIMAGRATNVWAAVSAWVPISDLAAWHAALKAPNSKYTYWKQMDKICGGAPGSSEQADAEYKQRSPLTHLPQAKGLPIDLNAGIHDGHAGSVPINQTLWAFNLLAEVNDMKHMKLTDEQIKEMTNTEKIPGALLDNSDTKPKKKFDTLFHRQAGPVRVTIFEGDHEINTAAACDWLATQSKTPTATSKPTQTDK